MNRLIRVLGEIRDVLTRIEKDLHRMLEWEVNQGRSAPDHWLERHPDDPTPP